MNRLSGFSFIELLIVLTLCGILGMLAIPHYTAHRAYTNRLEAEAKLTRLAIALEKYYAGHHTYTGATLKSLAFPEKIATSSYVLRINSATDSEFQVCAKPLAQQEKSDTLCGTLLLTSRGERSFTGSGGSRVNCW